MVRVTRGLRRGLGLRGGSRGRLGRRGLRCGALRCRGLRRRGGCRLRGRCAGRPESTGSAVATGPVWRALGLGRRRAAGHRTGLRAHERAHVLGGVWEQRHVTGPFERRGEHPLVLRAGAALAARVDLAAIADVATDATHLFEVDLLDLVHAERADLAAWPSRPAVAGPVATAVIAAAIARTAAGAAAVTTRTRTFLAHLVSLERDLVRVERPGLTLRLVARHRAAAHPGLTVAAAAEELEVVAADVEARLLDVVLVRVRAGTEAAVDVDLLALLHDLLGGLGLLAPAAHAVPVGLLGSLAAAGGHAVHGD